ncbi:ldb19 [Hyphodiscus hymeniophilus]|uniref:Ldb19 n=1 Tax=Hyphodiscus hymeniophilus TaxID=353542 RepID=A0A9P7AWU5_9HELO|nr:ldb19 [Hyphodiscus hymeniophilus]
MPFLNFRSHSNSLDLPTEFKNNKASRKAPTSRPPLSDRSPSSSGSSLNSVEEREGKYKIMPDSHKRLSFPGLTQKVPSPKSSTRSIAQHYPATLDCVIESPPLVFYGASTSSTGALLSGQIRLTVHHENMAIDKFKMRLALEVTRKKPFHSHCQECSHQSTDLTTWNFLQGPATLAKGEHSFPFSFLLPGHLPPTMKGSLSAIHYVLRATVAPVTGEPIKLSQVLNIKRAVNPGDTPRHSIRIFPPTNLTANCELPPVIHPIGETMISMRMDGVVKRNADTKTQTQWKLKRLTWRLEETQKTISPACPKHAAKLGNVEDAKKGIAHHDVRTIGTEEMKSGWKADYTSPDGTIELEFPFGVQSGSNPICDVKAEDGTEVSHVLIVEMIVAEEFAPLKKPSQVTPTGAARVLRMHFNINVTERAGLGISWDEEQPPLYENVPASPPAYLNAEIYDGEAIPDYEDLPPLSPLDNGEGSGGVGSNGSGSGSGNGSSFALS